MEVWRRPTLQWDDATPPRRRTKGEGKKIEEEDAKNNTRWRYYIVHTLFYSWVDRFILIKSCYMTKKIAYIFSAYAKIYKNIHLNMSLFFYRLA